MNASSTLTDALLVAGTVAIFFCVGVVCLYRVVVWARRRSKRAYVIGAALAPFIALGRVADPDFRIVQEAKQLKKREEDDAGDPPAPEDEAGDPPAPEDERQEVSRAVQTEAQVLVLR